MLERLLREAGRWEPAVVAAEHNCHRHRGATGPVGFSLENRHDCRGRNQRVRSVAAVDELLWELEPGCLKGLVHPRDLDLECGTGLADVVAASEPSEERTRSREI